MASDLNVRLLDGVSKTYPGGKERFEVIGLNFLPGVKVDVVGVAACWDKGHVSTRRANG